MLLRPGTRAERWSVARAVDQSAVRALMIMLWDSGHEVQAMSITDEPLTADPTT